MIHQLPIPESEYSNQLQKMKAQAAQIQDFAEYSYLQTPWAKTNQLTEKVQQFVEEWRAQLNESALSNSDRSIFFTLLGAVFNALPSYNELSTNFLTQAVRYDQQSFFAYLQLAISSTKAKNFRRAELMFELAHRFATPPLLSQLLSYQSLLYRLYQNPSVEVLNKAVQLSREAVEQNPNDERAWFGLGMSLLKISSSENELAKAGNSLRKAITIREQQKKPYPDARFNYGMLCRLRLDFQQAYDQFKQAHVEDPSLTQAVVRYNELETLISAAIGRISGRMLEIGVFQDPSKGLFGMVCGKNNFQVSFRILSKFDSQLPQFFIIQSIDEKQGKNQRCLFSSNLAVRELDVGAVVVLPEVFAKVVQLKTKGQSYQCVCVCFEGGQINVNGNDVQAAGKVVWQSELQ
ncbi:Conserved_hypothetical protein [Hexamita inflata]|uniref:Tetratricopeptide repeat protein n=1 Tax=Hexamita inflata TaxID=28002 RepID=A0AA86UCJ6_9EUKA|nr:Conserved hypothetical protein [Hexamita inflata]